MDTKGLFKKAVNLVTLASFLVWNLSIAVPEGGSVAQGSAAISQSGTITTVNQTSQNTVINWQSFNTASNETVKFNQPNSSAVALNRINNGLPTQFAGELSANGNVWILNPAGVLFTSASKVDVAGLLATTHSISDADFMTGNYKFNLVPGSEAASIINNGLISAKDSGIVALVAPHVQNNGLIQVNLGKVSLSSGASYVLDMYGDSLINFGSNAPIQSGSVSNAGNIIANGGKVYMTANYASGVLDNMISMTGSIEAKSVGKNAKGEIVLFGGNIQTKRLAGVTHVAGKLDTSDSTGESNRGKIETSGAYLNLAEGANIIAGMGGLWIIDPYNVTIVAGSGLSNTTTCTGIGNACGLTPPPTNLTTSFILSGDSTIGADYIASQLNAGTSVWLGTSNSGGSSIGNITISAPITQTAPVTLNTELRLSANNEIIVAAPINFSGGASLVFQSDSGATGPQQQTVIAANITTGGPQQYGQDVYISPASGNLVTLTSTNGYIAFYKKLNSDSATTARDLVLSAVNSNISFGITSNSNGDVVGGIFPLNTLRTSGFTAAYSNATSIHTNGAQTYDNAFGFFGTSAEDFFGSTVNFNGGIISAQNPNNGNIIVPTNVTVHGNAVIGGGPLGDTVTFHGPLGAVVVTGATTLNGVTTSATASQNYQGAVTLGTGTTNNLNATGNITFGSTIGGAGTINTNAAATAFNGAIGTPGIALANLSVTGLANFNSGVSAPIYVSGTQTYNNNVMMTSISSLTFGSSITSNTIFNGAVDRTGTSTNMIIAGNLTLGISAGSIGQNSAIGNLIVNGTTTAGNITTLGDQLYQGAYTLNKNSLLISTGGNITFGGTFDGAFNLIARTMASGKQVSFNGIVGGITPLTNLTLNDNAAVGTARINSTAVTTTGAQNYNTALIVGANMVLTSTGGGAFNFAGVSSIIPQSLTVTSTGLTTFTNSVGALGTLLVSGPANIASNFVNITSAVTFNGPVTLGVSSVGISTNPLGSIIFGSTINGASALTLNASSGTVTLNGVVGGVTKLTNILVQSALTLNSNVTGISTNGSHSYQGPVTLLPAAITFVGTNVGFGGAVNGPSTAINIGINPTNLTTLILPTSVPITAQSLFVAGLSFIGGNITTTNNQTYNGAYSLIATHTLTSNSGNITFGNTVNGAFNLIASAGGSVSFAGAVGNTTALNSLSVTTNNLTGPTGITFSNALDVSGAVTLNSTSQISTVSMVFGGAVGSLTPLGSLNISTNAVTSNTGINFLNTLNVVGSIIVNATGAGIGSYARISFVGAVGNLTPSSSMTVTADASASNQDAQIQIHAPVTVNGSVSLTTLGGTGGPDTSVFITDAPIKVLGGDFNINASGTGKSVIKFDTTSTIDVSGAVNLTTLGPSSLSAVKFSSDIGGLISPTSLTVSGGASVWFNFNNYPTFSIKTVNNQTYNLPVSLFGNSSLLSTAGSITFNSAVNSNGGLSNLILSPVLGSVAFNGAIGTSVNPLGSLIVNAGSAINFNSGVNPIIYVTGAEVFNAPVLINNNSALQFNGTSVTFNGGLNSPGLASDVIIENNLVLPAGTSIGQTDVLNSFIVNGSSFISGDITTANGQHYYGSITLGQNVLLMSPVGTIELDQGASGAAFNLTIDPTLVILAGTYNVANLTVVATSEIDFNNITVNTTAGQSYTAPEIVLQVGDSVLTDNSGAGIVFAGAIDNCGGALTCTGGAGPFSLTSTENGASSTVFNGSVGNASNANIINNLTINGSTTISGAVVINTDNNQAYNGLVTMNNNLLLTSLNGIVSFTLGTIGVNGITGPAYNLGVYTYNPLNGPSGAGISGTVNVANFTMGGTGGGNVSPLLADYSTVGGASAVGAWNNTVLDPLATGTYCVNGFCISGTRVLNIDASNDSKTYGQTIVPNPVTDVSKITITGLAPGDSITSIDLASAGYAPTASVAGSTYVITASNATGAGLSNHYTSIIYNNTPGQLTVNPALLTIDSNNINKTYGQTYTFAGTEFTVTGLLNSDTVTSVTLTSAGAVSTATVLGGSYVITPSAAVGTGLSNYAITYLSSGLLTINPALLTIASNNISKNYGQTYTFAGTEFTATGLLNSDTVSSVTLNSAGAASTATVLAGPYVITPSAAVGTGLSNYAITYLSSGLLTINSALLTIASNNISKNYGQTYTFAGTGFTVTGLLNSDTVSSVTLNSAGSAATATVLGGPYAITPSAAVGTGLSNYAITYLSNGLLSVNPALLTIDSNNINKTYGQTYNFTGTEFTVTGLLNSDTVSNVTLNSAGSVQTATVLGGPYVITPSAAVGTGLSNYAITYLSNGLLSVNPALLTIDSTAISKTYGQTYNFTGTEFTVTGLLNSDTVSNVTLNSAGSVQTATVLGGPYVITPSVAVGTGLSNYAITYLSNGLLNVDPALLTIDSNNINKTYGQTYTFAGTEFTATGLLNSDTVSSVTLNSAGTGSPATVLGGPYVITPSAAVGTGLSNYNILYDASGAITVTPALLTITSLPQSKTAGNPLSLSTTSFIASGLQNSETITTVDAASAGLSPAAPAGVYSYDSISNPVGTFDPNNYSIIYIVSGNVTVLAAPESDDHFNIPPLEMFDVTKHVSCDASGCNNLDMMIDNLVEAGIVECSGMNGCIFGFATAEDTNGKVRVLVPGSIVYAGDKIMKDKGTCVCVKSLHSDKKVCMGPKDQRAEVKA